MAKDVPKTLIYEQDILKWHYTLFLGKQDLYKKDWNKQQLNSYLEKLARMTLARTTRIKLMTMKDDLMVEEENLAEDFADSSTNLHKKKKSSGLWLLSGELSSSEATLLVHEKPA